MSFEGVAKQFGITVQQVRRLQDQMHKVFGEIAFDMDIEDVDNPPPELVAELTVDCHRLSGGYPDSDWNFVYNSSDPISLAEAAWKAGNP